MNGSLMILNAARRTARSSSALRSSALSLSGLMPFDRRDVERRREVVDDRVEQRLHALVLERRAAEHRDELEAAACPCGARATISASVIWSASPSRNFAMSASSTSAQASIIFSRSSAHLALRSAGISTPLVLLALRLVVEDGGLHRDEVDHALVLVLFADRPLDRHRGRRRGAR